MILYSKITHKSKAAVKSVEKNRMLHKITQLIIAIKVCNRFPAYFNKNPRIKTNISSVANTPIGIRKFKSIWKGILISREAFVDFISS